MVVANVVVVDDTGEGGKENRHRGNLDDGHYPRFVSSSSSLTMTPPSFLDSSLPYSLFALETVFSFLPLFVIQYCTLKKTMRSSHIYLVRSGLLQTKQPKPKEKPARVVPPTHIERSA